jgi:Tol biopolymer transport system component
MNAGHTDLFTATRSNPKAPFGNVEPLEGVNISSFQSDPTLTKDGLVLFFTSFGQAPGSSRIHYATRPNVNVAFTYVGPAPGLNDSTVSDLSPFLREDGAVLYFSSYRVSAEDSDIYRASWNGVSFDVPIAIEELASPFLEYGPVVTPDDRTIYFVSTRPDSLSQGVGDIWMATREKTDDQFSQPTIVSEVSTAGRDIPSFITRDGCKLYFFVDYTGTANPNGFISQFVAEKPVH